MADNLHITFQGQLVFKRGFHFLANSYGLNTNAKGREDFREATGSNVFYVCVGEALLAIPSFLS